jgi:hypothetical protein
VQATGWLWLDPVIAIAVALNILREGVKLVRRSADGLMDQALEPRCGRDRAVLAGFDGSDDPLRPRGHAPRRPAPLRRPAHAHAGQLDAGPRGGAAHLVEQALMAAVPGLRATIQLLPMDVEAHFATTREGPAVIALVQRVREARVEVAGAVCRRHRPGPAGAGLRRAADTEAQAAKLVDKLLKLRIFADEAGKMNRSVQDVGGGLLVVASSRWPPTPAAATGPASPAPRRPRRAARSTRRCCAWRATAPGGAGRRVRRRHAGAPGQRRAGDDPAALSDRPACMRARQAAPERPGPAERQARPGRGRGVGARDHAVVASVDAASPMRALSCATVQAASPGACSRPPRCRPRPCPRRRR